jgi:hypothetical protein
MPTQYESDLNAAQMNASWLDKEATAAEASAQAATAYATQLRTAATNAQAAYQQLVDNPPTAA